MDEPRELVCHTANLKVEAVKGIIQGSEFKPKLAKHAQCVARHCFKSQSCVSNHSPLKQTIKASSSCVEKDYVCVPRRILEDKEQ